MPRAVAKALLSDAQSGGPTARDAAPGAGHQRRGSPGSEAYQRAERRHLGRAQHRDVVTGEGGHAGERHAGERRRGSHPWRSSARWPLTEWVTYRCGAVEALLFSFS